MHNRRVTHIIRSAYGRKYKLDSLELVPLRMPFFSRAASFFRRLAPLWTGIRTRWFLVCSLAVTAFVSAVSVYYYNLLVTTEQDVLAARGKVDTLLQRRNDISINLSKAVLDYSQHERGVFTAVVTLRNFLSGQEGRRLGANLQGNGPPAVAPDESLSPLARLLAVVEQYPDLKLSANFQSLMTALINVEKDLAAERIGYNDRVNVYTTNLRKFPVNICAALFGFEEIPYFEAEEAAKKLVPISY